MHNRMKIIDGNPNGKHKQDQDFEMTCYLYVVQVAVPMYDSEYESPKEQEMSLEEQVVDVASVGRRV